LHWTIAIPFLAHYDTISNLKAHGPITLRPVRALLVSTCTFLQQFSGLTWYIATHSLYLSWPIGYVLGAFSLPWEARRIWKIGGSALFISDGVTKPAFSPSAVNRDLARVAAGVKAYAVISMRRCARVDLLAYGGLAGFAVCLILGVGGAVLGGGHVADVLGVEVGRCFGCLEVEEEGGVEVGRCLVVWMWKKAVMS
jgi:hypothetical protein